MKSLRFLISVLIIGVTFQSYAADFYAEMQALKIVRTTLKDKEIILVEKVDVSDVFGKTEPVVIYRFTRINGYDFCVIFAQAKGRYEMFDYLIVVNPEFAIEKISVLKYRSEHGGEIASKRWLKQFENYSSGELRYKKEISALSGATISANSIVADIPKVLKILKYSANQ